jgi:hypothetical protein
VCEDDDDIEPEEEAVVVIVDDCVRVDELVVLPEGEPEAVGVAETV